MVAPNQSDSSTAVVSATALESLTSQRSGARSALHPQTVQEGCVIKPTHERRHNDPDGLRLGRVVLKSVNLDYLVRQGATEYQ